MFRLYRFPLSAIHETPDPAVDEMKNLGQSSYSVQFLGVLFGAK